MTPSYNNSTTSATTTTIRTAKIPITLAAAAPTTVTVSNHKQPTTLTNLQRGNVRQEIKLQTHQKTVHELAAQGELRNASLDADERLVNVLDSLQLTPLIYAAYYGQWTTVEQLLTRGAIVDYCPPNTGQTALMFAAANDHQHCIKTLLRYNADINRTDHDGNSALHYAAQNNCGFAVKQLLASGADMYCKNNAGLIPYSVSVDVGSQLSLDEMNQHLRKTILEQG